MGHSGPSEERTVSKECAPDNSSSSLVGILTGSAPGWPDGGTAILASAEIRMFKQYKLNHTCKD